MYIYRLCGVAVSLGIDPGYINIPQSKIIFGVLQSCENVVNSLQCAWWPLVSVGLTVCFRIMLLSVGWEPNSAAVWASGRLFKLYFWRLTLSSPKQCHMDLWSARLVLTHPYCHQLHPFLLHQHQELRVSNLSFLSMVLFLWQAAIFPFSVKHRAAFQLSLFE
jgi:hypothetical protein